MGNNKVIGDQPIPIFLILPFDLQNHNFYKSHPLLLACLLFAGTVFAQQHLSFKDVPINGSLKEYTDAMIKAGFHYERTQDGVCLFSLVILLGLRTI